MDYGLKQLRVFLRVSRTVGNLEELEERVQHPVQQATAVLLKTRVRRNRQSEL